MLVLTLVLSFALGVARALPAFAALTAIFVVALIAAPFVPKELKRGYFYGALFGTVAALFALSFVVSTLADIGLIEQSFRSRGPGSEFSISFEQSAPYAVSLGYVFGAAVGMWLASLPKPESKPPEKLSGD